MGAPMPGRIPFVAIDAYAKRKRIAGEDFDMLDHLMAEMDAEYLAWHEGRKAS
jgi:hypothetical protein